MEVGTDRRVSAEASAKEGAVRPGKRPDFAEASTLLCVKLRRVDKARCRVYRTRRHSDVEESDCSAFVVADLVAEIRPPEVALFGGSSFRLRLATPGQATSTG